MIILAHGALGQWDEVVFIGVVILFIVMMVVSWFRSDVAIDPETPDETDRAAISDIQDHFSLD